MSTTIQRLLSSNYILLHPPSLAWVTSLDAFKEFCRLLPELYQSRQENDNEEFKITRQVIKCIHKIQQSLVALKAFLL